MKEENFQLASMYLFSKSSFVTAYATGKLNKSRPELTKLDLVHLNRKSSLLKDANSFLKRKSLPTFSANSLKLLKKHAYEVEFSPKIIPTVARIALQGTLLDIKEKERNEKIELSYKTVMGTDGQANFSLKYEDKSDDSSLQISLQTALKIERNF